jgi:molybdopterin-containing oxidoreductase family membrane subunit
MTDTTSAPVIALGRPRWPAVASVGLLLLVIAAALAAYTRQVTTGLAVTGLNTPAYWGLYVVNFIFFIGLSAGGVIVASLVHAFGLREFRPVARIAELMAIACLLLAMTFILLDLGRPDRMLFLLRHGRLQSPLIWDVTVVNAYLLISLTYGYFGTRADLVRAATAYPRRRGLYRLLALGYMDLSPRALTRDHHILRALAMVGLVGAIALHTVTAWILGLVQARPGWYGAIMAPLFIVSATVSGLALLLVSVVFCRHALRLPIDARVIRSLGRILAFAIPVLGYFLFAELLTVLYAREPAALRVFEEMMFGRYAAVFWGNLVLGLAVPMALLLVALFRTSADAPIGLAAALVVLGVLAERWNIVVPPLVGFSHLPYPPGQYTPTAIELLLVSGVYALGGLLFAFAARVLPLVESE